MGIPGPTIVVCSNRTFGRSRYERASLYSRDALHHRVLSAQRLVLLSQRTEPASAFKHNRLFRFEPVHGRCERAAQNGFQYFQGARPSKRLQGQMNTHLYFSGLCGAERRTFTRAWSQVTTSKAVSATGHFPISNLVKNRDSSNIHGAARRLSLVSYSTSTRSQLLRLGGLVTKIACSNG